MVKQKRKRIELPPPRKVGIAEGVSEAYGEIQSLAEEMRGWADNMEEKLSHTEKYERVSECADTLEQYTDEPDMDDLPDMEITIQDLKPKRRGYSRADRLSQALAIFDLAISACEDFEADDENSDEDKEKVESLRDELENAKGDLEGVEFPGMYG